MDIAHNEKKDALPLCNKQHNAYLSHMMIWAIYTFNHYINVNIYLIEKYIKTYQNI